MPTGGACRHLRVGQQPLSASCCRSSSYDANNVYLTLQIGGFAAAAATATQQTVGRVLDANVFTATGDFATVLGTMATSTQSPGARTGDADVAERPELLRASRPRWCRAPSSS